VVARLLATARDVGVPGRDDVFGYGVIRPYQAITENVPAEAPNPIFDRLPAQAPASTPTGLPSVLSTEPAKYPTVAGVGLLTLLVVGGVVVVVVVLVVVLVVLSRRRSQGPAPSGTGYPVPPGSAGPPGAPPPGQG
jgi:hypothetical protein